jgi:hypothetical protein
MDSFLPKVVLLNEEDWVGGGGWKVRLARP